MKKMLLEIVLILVCFTLVGCGKISSDDKYVLLSVSNCDFKYGATYDGLAILNDGTIYTLYYSSTKSDYNNYVGSYSIYTKGGFTNFVKDKWSMKDKKVSNMDLKKINTYISKLNKQDTNCQDSSVYSNLIIYKDDEALLFGTSGNCDVTSTNKNVKKLLFIVNKYK